MCIFLYLFIYLFCCSLCVRVCSFLCSDSLVYTSFFSFLFYTVVYTRDCSWDDKLGKPVTRFLDIPVGNSGSAVSLFELLDTALGSKEIPCGNVVGFDSDTANMMIGKHNSVLCRVKEKQPGVFSQVCLPFG